MSRDPLVAEVRAIREAFAKQFHYDLQAIYRHLKEQETKSRRKTVSLRPRRVEAVEPTAHRRQSGPP
jgi:hypothetical protein